MCKNIVFVIVLILWAHAFLFSATILVPDDYASIQEAIDAAVSGDTIIVRPGIYVENIDFLSKILTVKSSCGAAVTVIDGNQSGSVVHFSAGHGADTVLDGFTIRNGKNYIGGGVDCHGGPTIRYNIIKDNVADGFIISDGLGGGIYCAGDAVIKGNSIVGNVTQIATGNLVAGGGICVAYGGFSPIIEGNLVMDNKALWGDYGYGGGIYAGDGDSLRIINNIIVGNEARDYGGGICLSSPGTFIVENNTIYGNSADYGGGVMIGGSMKASMVNTVLWGNSAKSGQQVYLSSDCVLDISYSDVMGGMTGVHKSSTAQLNWGDGMIELHPMFADIKEGDFHLTYHSPCRDTGDNFKVTVDEDFEGDPRIAHSTVDMGADEFYTHLYITGDAAPGGTIEGKLVGLPGTTPVGLFVGTGLLPSPVPTAWGEFYIDLGQPWVLFYPLGAIPANGLMVLSTSIPGSVPAPYDLPMQALIGMNADSFTNVSVLEVR